MGLSELPLTSVFRPGWALAVYLEAREASGVFRSGAGPTHRYVAPGKGSDSPRALEEAARRARRTLRRYAASNRLNRLGTLTYGAPRCSDPAQVRQHAGMFFRSLRSALGGKPFPYIWVPELHKDGEHFHLHFAVGRYVPVGVIRAAWGRGHVHIKLLGNLPVGSGTVDEARLAARYLSKYVSKSLLESGKRLEGMHRYDLAQGFHPKPHRLYGGRTSDVVLSAASGLMGGDPVARWSSEESQGWAGPPALWAQWAG